MNRKEEGIALKAVGLISQKYRIPANHFLNAMCMAGEHEPVYAALFQKLTGASYVYGYRDDNDVLRYIGKGSSSRIFKHFSDKESAIYDEAQYLTPEILSAGISPSEAYELERHLIEDNRSTVLNRRPGIVPSQNDELRKRIAAAVVTCLKEMKTLPWDSQRKTGDAVALLSILLTAYHAGKYNGVAVSERDCAVHIGRTKNAALNALKSLCLLGFIKLSKPGKGMCAAEYNINMELFEAMWPINGTINPTHALFYGSKGDHAPQEEPGSPPLDAADADARSGDEDALTRMPPHGIAEDMAWVERLLASDAFRHGGLGKGALLIFLFMMSYPGTAFSPRELMDALGFKRSSMYRWIAKLRGVGYLVESVKGRFRAIMPSEEALDDAAMRLGTAGRGMKYRERFFIERTVYLSRILTGRTGDGFAILAEWIVKEYRRLLAGMEFMARSVRRVCAMPRLISQHAAWGVLSFVPMRC